MRRDEPASAKASNSLHPIGRQLLVQQLLGTLPIVDPKKLILTAFHTSDRPGHLPSQPLPAVDTDLNLEGEPHL